MSAADLVPIRTNAEAKRIGRLGGLARTQNKRIAAKIRELKKKGEDAEAIVACWEDGDYNAFEIMQNIKGLELWAIENDKHHMLPGIIMMKMQYHKMIHGDASSAKIEVNVDNRTQTISLDRFTQAYEDHHGQAKTRGLSNESGKGKRRSGNK